MTHELAASPPPPYTPPSPAAARWCPDCHADELRAPHDPACPQRGEIYRLSLDAEGRHLEDVLAAAMRRAWRVWVNSGRTL